MLAVCAVSLPLLVAQARAQDTYFISYGPHVVGVGIDPAGADQRDQRQAQRMAKQKQRELLACYRGLRRYAHGGQFLDLKRHTPTGTLHVAIETDHEGTMSVNQIVPKRNPFDACVRKAFDGRRSPFMSTRVYVWVKFFRASRQPTNSRIEY